jgi:CheY-like chemotaxis protein
VTPAVKMVKVPDPEIEIPSTDLIRVLLVDDEPNLLKSLSERLRDCGFDVDSASDLASAKRKLETNKYHVLIADVVLPGGLTGDAFVLSHEELVRDLRVVLMTGWGLDRIAERTKLAERGVEILTKGMPGFFDRITAATEEKLIEQTAQISRQIKESVAATMQMPSSVLLTEVQKIFVQWLGSRKEQEKAGIYYGGKLYSPRMLIHEIETGTEVGRAHLDMFVDLIKESLGVSGV